MDQPDYAYYKRELSRLNEIRKTFWTGLRSLRDKLLREYNIKSDAQCLELYRLINDMWESALKEELRRQTKLLPQRDDLLGSTANTQGLYESDRLCVICKLPIGGSIRKKYCTVKCRQVSKSRRYRSQNPYDKMASDFRYLDSILSEEEKASSK